MTLGIVTPTTNMCRAAKTATESGNRRRATRTKAPLETTRYCTSNGAWTPTTPPDDRDSSKVSSPKPSMPAASRASARPIVGRGRSQSSSTAKNPPTRAAGVRRAGGIRSSVEISPYAVIRREGDPPPPAAGSGDRGRGGRAGTRRAGRGRRGRAGGGRRGRLGLAGRRRGGALGGGHGVRRRRRGGRCRRLRARRRGGLGTAARDHLGHRRPRLAVEGVTGRELVAGDGEGGRGEHRKGRQADAAQVEAERARLGTGRSRCRSRCDWPFVDRCHGVEGLGAAGGRRDDVGGGGGADEGSGQAQLGAEEGGRGGGERAAEHLGQGEPEKPSACRPGVDRLGRVDLVGDSRVGATGGVRGARGGQGRLG